MTTGFPSAPASRLRPWRRASSLALCSALVSVHSLAQEPVEETEVLAEGQRRHPTAQASEPGVASWSASRARLDPAGTTLGDVLREAPGVQVSQLGGLGSPTTARLRGATSAQTPVYFGNIRLNDEVGGVADLGLVPNFLVERIDVYRSHAPHTATQLGLGGAIVLVPRITDRNLTLARGEIGSFGSRSVSSLASLSLERRAVSFGASLDAADNDYSFLDGRGTLFDPSDDELRVLGNADTQGKSFWASETERFGRATTTFLVSHFSREQGAPKLALLPTRAARVAYEKTLVAVTSRIPFERSVLDLTTTALLGSTTITDPALELTLLTERSRSPGERIEQIASLSHTFDRIVLRQQLSASVERLSRLELGRGGEDLALAARRTSLRAALSGEYRVLEGLFASGLVEGRCVSTSTEGSGACDQGIPGGRGGLRAAFGPVDVYASGAQYTRLPTLSELHGTSILVRGNPDLLPEEGVTWEAGARYQLSKRATEPLLWVDLSAYRRDSSKLITFVRSSQGYLSPRNTNRAETLGGELLFGARPLPSLFLEGQLTLQEPRDTSPERVTENDVLPFLSRLVASSTARYRVTFDDAFRSTLGLGARLTYQSSRYGDPAGLGVIPEQTSVDFEFEYSALESLVNLRTRLANAFDTRRYDVVGFPLPGRSLFLAMEIQWK